MTDPYLKRATAKFRDDLEEGFYDPSWQKRATKAGEERREGKFEDFVKQQMEDRFGGNSISVQSTRGATPAEGAGESGTPAP
jgi:hypothetical protein